MAFTLFKFLHILTMFVAVAVAVIPEVVLHWVAGSGDVRATRVFARSRRESASCCRSAEASGNDAPSPELELAVHDRRAFIGSAILLSAMVVIIFLMVFKPGS